MPTLALILLLLGLNLPSPARAGPSYVEVRDCRPPDEDGEFLQSCVKLTAGRRAGRVLGPGLVAPGGQAAAVLRHRRYGTASDRVTVRIYGPGGRALVTVPMGEGGDEFTLVWSPSGRFLAWVEVDGDGGKLRVVDRERGRLVLSARSPLEAWPIFSPSGDRVLLPAGRGSEDRVAELFVIDLLRRGGKRSVLQAGPDEELLQPRWLSPSTVQALRRKASSDRGGKIVQGSFLSPASRPRGGAHDD